MPRCTPRTITLMRLMISTASALASVTTDAMPSQAKDEGPEHAHGPRPSDRSTAQADQFAVEATNSAQATFALYAESAVATPNNGDIALIVSTFIRRTLIPPAAFRNRLLVRNESQWRGMRRRPTQPP